MYDHVFKFTDKGKILKLPLDNGSEIEEIVDIFIEKEKLEKKMAKGII